MHEKMWVSNKNETIPLFKNPVLEYFSHIHWSVPLIVYIPIILVSSYFGFLEIPIGKGILMFLAGILFWTITEYTIHRWAFHYHPKTKTGKYIHFLVHGIHHDYPRDATRLVMPLLVSVPLASIFFYLFYLLLGSFNLVFFAGFVLGYVTYDSIHYATHHINFKRGFMNWLRVYHLRHHYEDPNSAYGVSNPLWDYVFHTVPQYLIDINKVPDITPEKKQ